MKKQKVTFDDEDYMPMVDGKSFRCNQRRDRGTCGCNVFRRAKSIKDGWYIYKCNACGAEYLGKPL